MYDGNFKHKNSFQSFYENLTLDKFVSFQNNEVF
jgi:hypothetical protein